MVRSVHIQEKWRFVDEDAEQHPEPIHSVEIAADFLTIFHKGNLDGRFKNLGVPHNSAKFHPEESHTHWIKDQFPSQTISAEWDSHFHLMIDDPGWEDVVPFVDEMNSSLASTIREFFDGNHASQ